jgi:hypothetical protein
MMHTATTKKINIVHTTNKTNIAHASTSNKTRTNKLRNECGDMVYFSSPLEGVKFRFRNAREGSMEERRSEQSLDRIDHSLFSPPPDFFGYCGVSVEDFTKSMVCPFYRSLLTSGCKDPFFEILCFLRTLCRWRGSLCK